MRILLALVAVVGMAALAQNPSVIAPQTAAPKAPSNPKPVLVSQVEPEYTPAARDAGLQGTVLLYTEIRTDGVPSKIQLLHGLGMGLDEKAVEAVAKWRYQPRPAPVGQLAEVKFGFEGGGPWRVRLAAFASPVLKPGEINPRVTKATLLQYRPPAAPCPAEDASATIDVQIASNGSPQQIRTRGGALEPFVAPLQSWRFQPATVNRDSRESQASIEFECGPAVADPGVYRIGGGVSAPVATFKPEPEYSEEARQAKVTGEVLLSIMVDATGHPRDIYITRPLGYGLDQKAMEAVSRWRFNPAMREGQPVNVNATISVSFHLL